MSSRRVATVVAAGCLTLALGCGAHPAGGRSAGPGAPSPSSAVSPIPQVQNPRDVAAMARRTCELLTPQQAAGFGLDLPPVPSDGLFGTVYCTWRNTAPDRSGYSRAAISVFTNNPTLEAVYNRRDGFAYFELTMVGEYPATVTRSNSDLPVCSVDVKSAERQSFTVTYESGEFDNDPQQACVVGKDVADAVLMNLPPQA